MPERLLEASASMPLGIALTAEQLTALTPEDYTTFYQAPTVALTEDMQTLLTPAGYADFYQAMIDHYPQRSKSGTPG